VVYKAFGYIHLYHQHIITDAITIQTQYKQVTVQVWASGWFVIAPAWEERDKVGSTHPHPAGTAGSLYPILAFPSQ
jgi:hypothetical protein